MRESNVYSIVKDKNKVKRVPRIKYRQVRACCLLGRWPILPRKPVHWKRQRIRKQQSKLLADENHVRTHTLGHHCVLCIAPPIK